LGHASTRMFGQTRASGRPHILPRLLLLLRWLREHVHGPAYLHERERGREHSMRTPMREGQSIARVPKCEREGGGSTAHTHVLTWLYVLPWGTKPGGAAPDSASVGLWPALALYMRACTLIKECSAIWTLTVRCVHIRLLKLARMIEIGSAQWVCALRVCPRIRACGEEHLLQHAETR
jgi:hypothetical protein